MQTPNDIGAGLVAHLRDMGATTNAILRSGRPRRFTDRDACLVDDTTYRGLCDAVKQAYAVASRELGPEHGELLTWLQRARDCAEAA